MAARILGPKACLSCGEYCNLRGQQRVLGSFPLSSLLRVWMPSYVFRAQLLVDEEDKDSQKDNKNPNGRQEANGFRSD